MLCVTRFLKLADWFAAVTAVNGDHVSGGFCRLFCHGLSDQWTVRREARTVCLIRCLLVVFLYSQYIFVYFSYCVVSASSIFLLVYVSANRPHSHRKESRARCIPRNAVRRGSAEPEVKLLSVWRREDRLFPQSCSHSCCLDSFRSTVLAVANPSVFVALKTLTEQSEQKLPQRFLVLNSTLPPYLCHLAFRLESSDCNVLER